MFILGGDWEEDLQLAEKLLNADKFEEASVHAKRALDSLKEFVAKEPDNKGLWLKMAEIYCTYDILGEPLKQFENSAKCYTEALKSILKSDICILKNLGEAFENCTASISAAKAPFFDRVRAFKLAESCFRLYLEFAPRDADAWVSLGNTVKLGSLGKLEAKKYYEKALEIDPNNHRALINMAWFCEERGDHSGGIRYLLRDAETHPDSHHPWMRLGDAYFKMVMKGSADSFLVAINAAIEYYEKALEKNPNSSMLLESLATCYALKGEHDKSKEGLERAKALKERHKARS